MKPVPYQGQQVQWQRVPYFQVSPDQRRRTIVITGPSMHVSSAQRSQLPTSAVAPILYPVSSVAMPTSKPRSLTMHLAVDTGIYSARSYQSVPVTSQSAVPIKWTAVSVAVAEEANPEHRASMEDTHFIDQIDDMKIFGVCDGHCGKSTSEFLRDALPQYIKLRVDPHRTKRSDIELRINPHRTESKSSPRHTELALPDIINNICQELDNIICKKITDDSGSCMAMAILMNNKDGDDTLHVANVGDCRVVAIGEGSTGTWTARQLTFDHRPDAISEFMRVVQLGGKIIDKRVQGNLAVTRAFGDVSLKKYVTALPYQNSITISPTIKYIIIACDGLFDFVSLDQIARIVHHNRLSNTQSIASLLAKQSLANGGTDNVTVMVIQFAWANPTAKIAL